MYQIVPVLGVLAGIIIPVSVFIWLYFEGKDKNKTIVEIAKHLNDPSKVDEFLQILDERKKEPIDYRRGGVITAFVGIGIYILGYVSMGNFFEGIGLLVATIGIGSMLAGYLYPNTSEELTTAVEKFEEK
jgi:hypothetical protein|tara:strand:- start:264 stop:653 length:390 start_codon:yes stop_codon:yes gene_type:complete